MIQLKYSRQRIFVAFFVYTLLSFVVATLSFWLFRRVESITILADKVHQLHFEIRNLSKLRSDFLLNETTNEAFYKTGYSFYLKEYKITQILILISIDSIKNSPQAKKWNMNQNLDSLKSEVETSAKTMRELAIKIQLRGYKNYGLEGAMKKYIQQLEKEPNINRVLVLQLERQENNFIHTFDSLYLRKWNQNFQTLYTDITTNKKYKVEEKNKYLAYLNAYKDAFDYFVKMDYEIGHRQESGFAAQTNQRDQIILNHIDQLDNYSQKKKDTTLIQLRFITVVVVTISVIASMLLSLSFPYIMKI